MSKIWSQEIRPHRKELHWTETPIGGYKDLLVWRSKQEEKKAIRAKEKEAQYNRAIDQYMTYLPPDLYTKKENQKIEQQPSILNKAYHKLLNLFENLKFN